MLHDAPPMPPTMHNTKLDQLSKANVKSIRSSPTCNPLPVLGAFTAASIKHPQPLRMEFHEQLLQTGVAEYATARCKKICKQL